MRRPALALAALLAVPAAAAPGGAAPDAAPADAVRVLVRARDGLRAAVAFARSRPDVFSREAGLPPRESRQALWTTWASVLDHTAALEPLRAELDGWARARGPARDATFSVGYAAFLAQYRYALDLLALADRNPLVSRILDEAVPELGLPAGAWARYQRHWLNAARATEFAALELVARRVAPLPELAAGVAEDRAAVWQMGKGKGYGLTARSAGAAVARAGLAAVFPVQKGVSTWMGDTRVRRGAGALVSPAQVAALPARLEPGDVLLERREWFLSNLGLPGFWTHAAIYVGTPEERRAWGADPEVRAWVRSEGREDGDLEALLEAREPAAGAASRAADAAGHPPRVLEAISEGVTFTSIEHSGAADSLAALRPRGSRAERARALLRAFHYAGRPYDFDFDFATDSALVCSELVWKAYEPGPDAAGLRIPLEEIAGRRIATPNGIARQWDEETAAGHPQLDLVLFLDGSERAGVAREAGAEAFRASWRRPKWHILAAP